MYFIYIYIFKVKLRTNFLRQNPLAADPIVMNPELRERVSDLLVCGGEIHEIGVGAIFSSDNADPPTIVVESIDLLVSRKPPNRDGGRQRTKLLGVHSLSQKLGLVVFEQGLVLDDVEAIIELRNHLRFVVRSMKPVFLDGDFHALASAKVDLLDWRTHGFWGFENKEG